MYRRKVLPPMSPAAPITKKAYSINEFLQAYSISRAGLYVLWASGRGPKVTTVGGRRLICVEAAEEWFKTMAAGKSQDAV